MLRGAILYPVSVSKIRCVFLELTVQQLADAIGFEAIDCGPLLVSLCIEPLALLWIRLVFFSTTRPGYWVSINAPLMGRWGNR